MHSLRTRTSQVVMRLAKRDPAQLWSHYLLCVSLFLVLVFTTHWLNLAALERGVSTADAVQKSNQQVHLARDLLLQAGGLDSDDPLAVRLYEKALQQISTNHVSLTGKRALSDELDRHFFRAPQPLDSRMREFITLSGNLTDIPPPSRAVIIRKLHTLFYARGLQSDLVAAATLFARQFENEAAQYTQTKLLLLLGSIVGLLIEATFIFWPAKRAIETKIAKMKRQTTVLRLSKARLKLMNKKLQHISQHDALTGLPNRSYLTTFLADGLKLGKASSWQIYLIGLDDFKTVNDLMGHQVGDTLLVAVGKVLKDCANFDDLVAHVGGDKFVLISDEAPASVLNRIMAAFDDLFLIVGRNVSLTASIGHLPVGTQRRDPQEIIADAEVALQFAKGLGRKQSQEFTHDLRETLRMTHTLQLDLQDAIQNGEIEPWFQPQLRLADGSLHGAEVLARWRHPTRGLLSPDMFLPAAERAGLMIELDHAVWKAAMRLAQQWKHDALWNPLIALNAAPDTIADPHILERFLLLLRKSGLGADQVTIEVLETTLIKGKDDIAAINIDSLAECGIALELDDFGTGYASLSKLTQLPLAGIKIDRTLIAPLPDQAADTVVRAILALAGELGLHVVAEGIEEEAQAIHLRQAGCCVGQGYGFGKPMPADEFREWLIRHAATRPVAPLSRLPGLRIGPTHRI